ncbi:hypothetical protein QTO30_04930 [Yoonia sp. GPGPB17]
MAEASLGTVQPSADFTAEIEKAEAFLRSRVEGELLIGMQENPVKRNT